VLPTRRLRRLRSGADERSYRQPLIDAAYSAAPPRPSRPTPAYKAIHQLASWLTNTRAPVNSDKLLQHFQSGMSRSLVGSSSSNRSRAGHELGDTHTACSPPRVADQRVEMFVPKEKLLRHARHETSLADLHRVAVGQRARRSVAEVSSEARPCSNMTVRRLSARRRAASAAVRRSRLSRGCSCRCHWPSRPSLRGLSIRSRPL